MKAAWGSVALTLLLSAVGCQSVPNKAADETSTLIVYPDNRVGVVATAKAGQGSERYVGYWLKADEAIAYRIQTPQGPVVVNAKDVLRVVRVDDGVKVVLRNGTEYDVHRRSGKAGVQTPAVQTVVCTADKACRPARQCSFSGEELASISERDLNSPASAKPVVREGDFAIFDAAFRRSGFTELTLSDGEAAQHTCDAIKARVGTKAD
jgi:hypothetical protein